MHADLIRRVVICSSTSKPDVTPSFPQSLNQYIEQSVPSTVSDPHQVDAIARAISQLYRVQTVEWNVCKISLPAAVLSAILSLPDLLALQMCSVPLTLLMNISAPLPKLRSLRILRLRSLDETRTVSGILKEFKDSLTCLSIRVAERDDLSADVVNDVDRPAWHAHPNFQQQQQDEAADIDLETTNLKSKFLEVLLKDIDESDKLSVESLALFDFPRINLEFLASRVSFSALNTLRLHSTDSQVFSTLTTNTVLPRTMKTLDLTLGKAAFPLSPIQRPPQVAQPGEEITPIDTRPPMMSTLLRDLYAVEYLNLKLLCEPLTESRVMSEHIAPWLLQLNRGQDYNSQYRGHLRRSIKHSRQQSMSHRTRHSTRGSRYHNTSSPIVHLRKLSIHIWSISAGQNIVLAAWSLDDLRVLATSAAGKHIQSLAIDFSRNATSFNDLVTHMQKFPVLHHLYLNYTPTVYYGIGIYDICRRQATILKSALPNLELLWMNSVELVVPIRRKRTPSVTQNAGGTASGSSGTSTPVVAERSVVRSQINSEAIAQLTSDEFNSGPRHTSGVQSCGFHEGDVEADDNDALVDDEEDDMDVGEGDGYDEHFGDEFFADDNNFHIFATKLF